MTTIEPKAIFFDLDDTIISFDGVAAPAWSSVCQTFAQDKGLFSAANLLDSIRSTSAWYWSDAERHRLGRMDLQSARRDVVKLALEKLNCRDDTYAFEIADRYSQLRNELIYVFPGARETLARFCARDIPLALITNGTAAEQRAKLARFDLAWYFQAILIEGEVGLGKPDERVFQLCLDKFRLRANQVWMVGDNLEWDVAAPQRVGIHSIWNDCKGRGLLPDSPIVPDRIVRSISEIVF